jgi:uncharacterized protein
MLLAGFFQGMTGFGFSLIATPLLSLVLDVRQASNIVLGFIFFTSFLACYQLRRQICWKWKWDFILGQGLGLVVGIVALAKMDGVLLKQTLGVGLLAISVQELFFSKKMPLTTIRRGGLPLGLWSGALAGSFNMGGPPAVIYAYSQPWTKEDVIVQLQILFIASAIIRTVFVGVSSQIGLPLIKLFIVCMIPVCVGTYLGQRLFRTVSDAKLKVVVFVCLGLLGLKFIIWS